MEKDKNFFYKFFKPLFWCLFKGYYRPKTVNKKIIPDEGPIIICGNHIHLYDQCFPILSTKRILHYMAKKEYFDSKFAWFFKAAGCISVDRENHGGDSKEIAIDYLNKGFAIGIYPEGTRDSLVCKKEKFDEVYSYIKDEIGRNKYKKLAKKGMFLFTQTDYIIELHIRNLLTDEELKKALLNPNDFLLDLLKDKKISDDEYKNTLMLPLKFGAVSMAQKTGATIIPYALTGKYKFLNNKLKCTFLKPIKVSQIDDLEKVNNELRNMIIDEIYQNEIKKIS